MSLPLCGTLISTKMMLLDPVPTLSKHHQFSLSKETWAKFCAVFYISLCSNMCSPCRISLCAETMPVKQFLHPLFCKKYRAEYFHCQNIKKPWSLDLQFQNSAVGYPAFLSPRNYISWLFPSPSHVEVSAFTPSFPLTMGTSQAFLITKNAGTETLASKLCHRFPAI